MNGMSRLAHRLRRSVCKRTDDGAVREKESSVNGPNRTASSTTPEHTSQTSARNPGQSQDETQIRQMMADQQAAMRARDAAHLVSRYVHETVKFDLSPPLQHAGPSIRDADRLRSWFAGFDGPIDYEIRDLAVTAGQDVAFCHSLNRLATTPRGAPQGFSLWFRATVCLQTIAGAWRITHEHNSTPFYMDGSLRAALDLEP
jgi:ketosteroid isomerase-like protein